MNKNFTLIALILSMSFLSCSSKITEQVQGDLPTLIPYRSGKHWGYCDKDKNIKIKCKYDDVTFFNAYGLAQVFKENPNKEERYNNPYLIGIIDTLGIEIIPPGIFQSFKQITYDGGNTDKYGPFDAVVYGDIQLLKIEKTFENLIGDCDEGLSEFKPREINFSANIILVHENYEVGTAYNRNGDFILPDSFTIVLKGTPKTIVNAEFYFAARHITQRFFQVFDKDGELLNKKKFKEVKRLNDSLYIGIDFFSGQYGVYNYLGEVLFEDFKYITPCFERENKEMELIALYTTNHVVFYSLKHRRQIIEPTNYSKFYNRSQVEFKNIVYHNNMLLIYYGKDKSEFGLFSNETGEMLVKDYKQMEVDFSFELIMAKNDKTVHLYDFNANLLNKFQDVDTVIPISQNHFLVSRNNKVGVWSQQTKTYIIDIAFENIDFSLPDVFLAQNSDKKITVYDTLGNKVFPQLFEKHQVIYENINTVGVSYRNIGNKEAFNIKPSLVYSGNSKSFHFQFTQEQYYMPDNIVDFYNKEYDQTLKELKKEIITVVLEDSIGNQFRLMPDYSLMPLLDNSVLVYRIKDLYFYKANKENQILMVDKQNEKHFIDGYEIKYDRNSALIIIIKKDGMGKLHYALNPETGNKYSTSFQSLEFKHFENSLYYYGESSSHKMLLSNNLNLLFSTNKAYEIDYKTKNYYIIITDTKNNTKYRVYNNENKQLYNYNCVIFPTRIDSLLGVRSCEHDFIGYVNVNGTKYFD
jgi:hypothetical protein